MQVELFLSFIRADLDNKRISPEIDLSNEMGFDVALTFDASGRIKMQTQ